MSKEYISKEDLYCALAERYGWTFEQIADMTPQQQYIAHRGPKIVKMTSDEYEAFQRRRGM